MNKKKILIGIGLLLIAMQFFQIDKSPIMIDNRVTFATNEKPPQDVLAQLKSSCYDCHSNETKYPWYTYVAPVSFWIRGHIKNARKALNFSTWTIMSKEDRRHALRECAEEIEEGHMPPKGYYRMHGDAYLDDAKKVLLQDWFEQQSLQ
ncbi:MULTISPECIES: heme-binding domain-containing protein [unclassified Aureispira]|uniref:heme-binding domain-containing protein n=1 Tax=unclassified Aureispira TaxID=2649989 RepID=UPI000696B076|nr:MULTISPECIES: heme-binding domain-containing protein [unclassified Aureispira]WMX12946.1 heme-binding domain-containing protein [Aureispira sp. CCB-E]